MSKEKNSEDLDLKDNKHSQLSKDNEIIEEIINNPLILKDIEDLEEEEEEEDSYSEKDKITEEILNNKVSFIISEKKEQKQNENKSYMKKNSQKIHKDIIENLLIELFEYHYNEISTEKKKILGNKILESKYHIGFFCTKLNKNFSKYILLILEQKIYELIDYIENLSKTKLKTVKDILEIKKSLKSTGRDIEKIFEKPFQRTQYFDISSVLIVLFISDLLNDNFINLTDKEYEEIIQAESLEEKDRFEKYIEECKLYFEKLENGENEDNDEDVEVYYEIQKQNENIEEVNYINNNINNEEEEEEKEKEIENPINEENKCNTIKNNDEKKDVFPKEETYKNNKANPIKNENLTKNSNDSNKNSKDANNLDNKIEQYSNIEELVNYINGSDKKKKKKKKRKKKTKVAKKENNIIVDDVFENFKANLINFSNNLEKVKKIKPKISEEFLEKLKLIN